MTQFTNENLLVDGNMIYFAKDGYSTPWTDRKFVARFKYSGGGVTKARFLKTLKRNYTAEQYLNRIAAGESPLQILMNDGLLEFNAKTRKFALEGKVL